MHYYLPRTDQKEGMMLLLKKKKAHLSGSLIVPPQEKRPVYTGRFCLQHVLQLTQDKRRRSSTLSILFDAFFGKSA